MHLYIVLFIYTVIYILSSTLCLEPYAHLVLSGLKKSLILLNWLSSSYMLKSVLYALSYPNRDTVLTFKRSTTIERP